MKVKEIMNKAFVMEENISLKEAAKIMSDKAITYLIIMKKDKIDGIVTEKELAKNGGSSGKKVRDVMSTRIVTVKKNDSIDDAAKMMAQNRIRVLPVMDKTELVGVITSDDLIANSDDLNEELFID
ncbi:MAG: CBS domain-containing protein [Nanoarchaeota archaeon]|nr:CBS domain-containing protein [Nanoarchaeota archaeon]